MKKKKNIVLRILCAMLFVLLSGIIMLSIYTLSNEDGFDSSVRSESVTESLKQEVKDRLENTPEGVALSERIKGIVIRFSPYGSDWNANVRKLAHFSIYFALASMIYITLAILGRKKLSRIFLTVLTRGVFAVLGELHHA
ncbi:VanZ family protein, partial [uncultured Dubosiella sp.]|uniref:VanZ family protein n=1 Tax=uncultured Dubosiella sp. TaxID=1937011 RepID=UPI00259934C8